MINTKVGSILTKLLSDQNLRVSELARRVQLPQPTIQRIASGVCENPYITSLKPIADYFSITVDQLKGLEPIPTIDNIHKLPLISWAEAIKWKSEPAQSEETVIADFKVGKYAYALKVVDGAMEPIFPTGSVLIVDPEVQPKDRSYVIALLSNCEIPVFRQLVINGQDKYLKPLNPDTEVYKMTLLNKSDNILSTLVQARWNYTG